MKPSPSKGKPGKRFEEDWQRSAEDAGLYVFKLRDCGGWGTDSALRFTPSNPFDFFMYDGELLFALEMKSTAGKSLRYDAVRDNQTAGMNTAAAYGIVSGLVVNFRSVNQTYFIDVVKLGYMESWSEKKSFNVEEAAKNGVLIRTMNLSANRRPRYELSAFVEKARTL